MSIQPKQGYCSDSVVAHESVAGLPVSCTGLQFQSMANLWRYYKRFGKRFLLECGHSWRAEVYSSVLAAFAVYILTRASDQNAVANLKTALLAAGIVLAAFAGAHIFRVPVLLDEERRKKEEMLGSEIVDLTGKLRRKLNIPKISHEQPVANGGMTHYIDVINESDRSTVTEVKVKLMDMEPPPRVAKWLPIPLHIKHDNKQIADREFNMNPGRRFRST